MGLYKMFNIAEGIKACRKAYNEGTLQFQGPAEVCTSEDGGCTYFAFADDGKCYTCAVGAMMTQYQDKILNDKDRNLNANTAVDTLMHNLGITEEDDVPSFFPNLKRLQRHHDELTNFIGRYSLGVGLDEDDARYFVARKAELERQFVSLLDHLEELYS